MLDGEEWWIMRIPLYMTEYSTAEPRIAAGVDASARKKYAVATTKDTTPSMLGTGKPNQMANHMVTPKTPKPIAAIRTGVRRISAMGLSTT